MPHLSGPGLRRREGLTITSASSTPSLRSPFPSPTERTLHESDPRSPQRMQASDTTGTITISSNIASIGPLSGLQEVSATPSQSIAATSHRNIRITQSASQGDLRSRQDPYLPAHVASSLAQSQHGLQTSTSHSSLRQLDTRSIRAASPTIRRPRAITVSSYESDRETFKVPSHPDKRLSGPTGKTLFSPSSRSSLSAVIESPSSQAQSEGDGISSNYFDDDTNTSLGSSGTAHTSTIGSDLRSRSSSYFNSDHDRSGPLHPAHRLASRTRIKSKNLAPARSVPDFLEEPKDQVDLPVFNSKPVATQSKVKYEVPMALPQMKFDLQHSQDLSSASASPMPRRTTIAGGLAPFANMPFPPTSSHKAVEEDQQDFSGNVQALERRTSNLSRPPSKGSIQGDPASASGNLLAPSHPPTSEPTNSPCDFCTNSTGDDILLTFEPCGHRICPPCAADGVMMNGSHFHDESACLSCSTTILGFSLKHPPAPPAASPIRESDTARAPCGGASSDSFSYVDATANIGTSSNRKSDRRPSLVVVCMENLPWSATCADVIDWLGGGILPDSLVRPNPIHIAIELTTGKTSCCAYIECRDIPAARKIISGVAYRSFLKRPVVTVLASEKDLLNEVFGACDTSTTPAFFSDSQLLQFGVLLKTGGALLKGSVKPIEYLSSIVALLPMLGPHLPLERRDALYRTVEAVATSQLGASYQVSGQRLSESMARLLHTCLVTPNTFTFAQRRSLASAVPCYNPGEGPLHVLATQYLRTRDIAQEPPARVDHMQGFSSPSKKKTLPFSPPKQRHRSSSSRPRESSRSSMSVSSLHQPWLHPASQFAQNLDPPQLASGAFTASYGRSSSPWPFQQHYPPAEGPAPYEQQAFVPQLSAMPSSFSDLDLQHSWMSHSEDSRAGHEFQSLGPISSPPFDHPLTYDPQGGFVLHPRLPSSNGFPFGGPPSFPMVAPGMPPPLDQHFAAPFAGPFDGPVGYGGINNAAPAPAGSLDTQRELEFHERRVEVLRRRKEMEDLQSAFEQARLAGLPM